MISVNQAKRKGFYEHYGLRRADNVKLYDKEKYLYYKLGKFSWEV